MEEEKKRKLPQTYYFVKRSIISPSTLYKEYQMAKNTPFINFNSLPQDIVAKTLSYVVSNTRDLAHLRLVSKDFKVQILPYVLQNLNVLSCNYGRTDFLTELLECEDDGHTGELWEKFQRRINREGYSLQSIFLVQDSRHHCSKTVCSIEDNDEIVKLCDGLFNVKNLEELTQLMSIAKKNGMFSPQMRTACNEVVAVSIPNPSNRLSAISASDVDEYERTHSSIVTLTLPRNASCVEEIDGAFIRLQTTELFQEALAPFLLRNEDLKATFGGQIINKTRARTTVRIPMYLRSSSDTFWDLNQIAISELLHVKQLFDKYNENTSPLEGLIIVDGVFNSCQCDRFTNDINMFSDLKLQDCILESHENHLFHKIFATDVPIAINICKDGISTILNDLHLKPPRKEYPNFYSSLERLISQVLPFMEVAYNDAQIHSSFSKPQSIDSFSDEWFDDYPPSVPVHEENKYSLRGKTIHLLMQLVDITLSPGERSALSGIFKNIPDTKHVIATVIFIPHRDDGLVGGEIVFNRDFYQDEINRVQCASSVRCMPQALMDVISRGQHPLGRVGLLEGRVIVYPKHCHVHECIEWKHRIGRRNNLEASGVGMGGQSGSPEKPKKMNEKKSNQSSKMMIFHLIDPEY